MNERATLLTGEALSWQLTNSQRLIIGLPPVKDDWQLTEVPSGILADRETYIYTVDSKIMRVISAGETSYEECCINASLTADRRIAPAKDGGKSIPLTAANLHKQRKLGVSLLFDAHIGAGMILIKDHPTRRIRLELYGKDTTLPHNIAEFARWIDNWCQGQ